MICFLARCLCQRPGGHGSCDQFADRKAASLFLSNHAARETLRFAQPDNLLCRIRKHLKAFDTIESEFYGKYPKAERERIFTVRFTVKNVCLNPAEI
jgi:hypothetical protein